MFRNRRARQAFFLSGIFFFSAASVYALSPKSSGPTDRMSAVANAQESPKRASGLCSLHREREVLESFGADTREATPRQASTVDPCQVIERKGDAPVRETRDGGLESQIRDLVSGYPIEAMVPAIAKFDRHIAALLVGIAKKESDWGNHAPSLAGEDCRNYWGLKGSGSRGTSMGYACFGSPEEAAKATGDRIAELVDKRRTSDPGQLIAWKCGSSCEGHSPESVRNWISNVRLYYDRIAKS